MKTIGFIDYYLDEWHANNYPGIIKEKTNGEFNVRYAYGKIDHPNGGISNIQWAKEHDVELFGTIEEVIEKSDVLVVLSPDNPEMHEELTDLPLKSGKLVYVDKTFAPDRETAERIFENAEKHNTTCFSSSALRFAAEYKNIDRCKIHKIYSEGPGTYEMYSIHQIEPIVMLMGCRAKRVMGLGDLSHPSIIIEFEDGRYAQIRQCAEAQFKTTLVDKNNNFEDYIVESDYFGLFMEEMIKFFKTGKIPVEHSQTMDVIGIRKAGLEALKTPFTWIYV